MNYLRRLRLYCLVLCLGTTTSVLANAEKSDGHGGAKEKGKAKSKPKDKKSGEHKGGEGEKKEGGKNEGEEGEGSPELSSEYIITDTYVHQWVKFPDFKAQTVIDPKPFHFQPQPGRATVVVFVASWNRPSQTLMKQFLALAEKFEKLHTDFVFVFSHDTAADALGFAEHMQMDRFRTLLATPDILKEFREPELPSIFIGDRTNWLLKRYMPVVEENLGEIDDLLRGINNL